MDNEIEIINSIDDHKLKVKDAMNEIINRLIEKSVIHDSSKKEQPEFLLFIKFLSEIKNYKFGTKEYNNFVENNEYCKYHFSVNDHHPEYFRDGVRDMDIVNITEMFADWIASSSRSGNVTRKQVIENIIKLSEKFKLGDILTQILINSVPLVI